MEFMVSLRSHDLNQLFLWTLFVDLDAPLSQRCLCMLTL